MDVHTEGLHSILLLEDALDREVERLEEELAWNRRKYVYLRALGCAGSDLSDLDLTIQRSEGLIITMKQLLQQTFNDRLICAEKVERQLGRSERAPGATFDLSLPQPASCSCCPSRYHHHHHHHDHHSLQHQFLTSRDARDTRSFTDLHNDALHDISTDRDASARNTHCSNMRSRFTEENSASVQEHSPSLSKPPKTYKTNTSVSQCSCKLNGSKPCGTLSSRCRLAHKEALCSRKIFLRKPHAHHQYKYKKSYLRKCLAGKATDKRMLSLTPKRQYSMKQYQRQRMENSSFISQSQTIGPDCEMLDIPKTLCLPAQISLPEESSAMLQMPNLFVNSIDLTTWQNCLSTERGRANYRSSEDTSRSFSGYTWYGITLPEELPNDINFREG